MKYSVTAALLTVYYVITGIVCLVWAVNAINATPTLPCTVSEISPDFTPEMRKACSELRSNNLTNK